MDTLQKVAATLVECGYAAESSIWSSQDRGDWIVVNVIKGSYSAYEEIAPFYDGDSVYLECLARRQADAIEDWLNRNQTELWVKSFAKTNFQFSANQWRLDRIKWCLEELCK